MLEHPEIAWIERTGYPSWLQEPARFEKDWDLLREEWEPDEGYPED